MGLPKLDNKRLKTLSGLMSLAYCCNIQMVGSGFSTTCKHGPILSVSMDQAPGGVIFSWHTLDPLVAIEHCLKGW